MPNYTFKCLDCENVETQFMSYKEMKETFIFCSKCASTFGKNGHSLRSMERVLKSTSTALQTKEVIDNGLLPKRIERLADVSEMVKQRADENDKS